MHDNVEGNSSILPEGESEARGRNLRLYFTPLNKVLNYYRMIEMFFHFILIFHTYIIMYI
jgi:hypothetical protein